jgi:NitT/TauT family transport system substrate-binding protein
METSAVNALLFLADKEGFFAANGLQVTFLEYASGLNAVDAMLNDEVDIVTASEFVVVGKAFDDQPVLTLGSVDKFMHNYLIGRKDRDIQAVADLAGKKVGLPMKTAAEFYLGRFLDLYGLSIDQVILVQVNPSELVETLANGEVDAVVAWQPHARRIEERLGEAIVKWPVQNEQVTYCCLVVLRAWAEANPQQVERILRSLAQAEAYYLRDPGETRAKIQEWLKLEEDTMAIVWAEHQFQLSLDQSLILAMEDEARWMILNGMVDETQVPNFLDFIDEKSLAAIKPEAVNLIR